MTDRWNLIDAQQRLLNVLALLEEGEFIAILRALQREMDGNAVVELACHGLDQGLPLMDVFGPDGPLAPMLEDNAIVLDTTLHPGHVVLLVIGTSGPDCDLYAWHIELDDQGEVYNMELKERRNEWLRETEFSTTLCLS